MYGKNVILFAYVNKTIIVLRNLADVSKSIAMKFVLRFGCFQIYIILKDRLGDSVLYNNT